MIKTCYIVGAGEFHDSYFTPVEGDYVIAADAGYLALQGLHYTPDVLMGDFDSLEEQGVDIDQIQGPYQIRLPKEKDDTDMLAAIREGRAQGYDHFIILGATGGRIDHTIANIQCLVFLSRQGCTCKIYGEGYEMQVVTAGSIHFPAQDAGIISVFAVGDNARGVTIRGLKYELQDVPMSNDYPIGVSNEFVGQDVFIEVKKGTLLIIRYL